MRASAVDMAGAIAVPAQEAKSFLREFPYSEPRIKRASRPARGPEGATMCRAVAVAMVNRQKSRLIFAATGTGPTVSRDSFVPEFEAPLPLLFTFFLGMGASISALRFVPGLALLGRPGRPCHEADYTIGRGIKS